MKKPSWGLWLCCALATMALIACLWRVDYVPTHDGPQHLFQGFLEGHLTDPGRGYDQFFERGRPRSSLGFHVLFAALEPWLGWRSAYRAALTVICLAFAFGYLALVRALAPAQPARAWLGLLGFGAALGWALFMGFFSFVLATALGFATLAVAVRRGPWTWRTLLVIGLGLTLQAVTHVFGALSCGLVLGCLVLSGHAGRRVRMLLGLALAAPPVLAIVLSLSRAGGVAGESVWLGPLDQLRLSPRFFAGGPWWRSLPIVLLAAAGIATSLRAWRRAAPSHAGLALASLLLWLAAIAAPLHLASWQLFAPRFLVLPLMLGAALVPVERLRGKWQVVAPVGAVAITTLSLGWAGQFIATTRARIAPALAGLSAPVERNGPRMVVVLDPYAGLASGFGSGADAWDGVALPHYAPLFNLGALYAIEQGGVPTYVFSGDSSLHPFVRSEAGQARLPPVFSLESLRDPVVLGDRGKRRALLDWLASLGTGFDDVIVYGEAADAQRFVTRGYSADVHTDGLLVGRFQGCDLKIAVRGADAKHPVHIAYGWGQVEAPPITLTPEQTRGGKARITLPRSLCGATWANIWLDRDASGDLTPADARCAEARDDRVTAVITPSAPQLDCHLEP